MTLPELSPPWTWVPIAELGQHKGRLVRIFRSQIPTRIVDATGPDDGGVVDLLIEWTEPTSVAGGLIRHPAGRRETYRPTWAETHFPVRITEPEEAP